MGWFRPTPMGLRFGEPLHQMAARALISGAIHIDADSFGYIRWKFVGPHGISYEGKARTWIGEPEKRIAKICEEVQQDFNERVAAMNKAREYVKEKLEVPPLFSLVDGESA